MQSAIDVFTKFVNSPGGVLTAGAVLAGFVWKFFERVEATLTEQTKLEIAVWLVGVRTANHVPWPETFLRVFNRVFGDRHLSWKCFYRSAIASIICGAIALVTVLGGPRSFFYSPDEDAFTIRVVTAKLTPPELSSIASWLDNHVLHNVLLSALVVFLIVTLATNVFPDFISLFETRILLNFTKRLSGARAFLVILPLDLVLTVGVAGMWNLCWYIVCNRSDDLHIIDLAESVLLKSRIFRGWLLAPSLFTSVWLWLYAGSGFLLKAAHRFDLGFDWFNRKFDIEKHPLRSIGLVAGAIVAVVYWTVAGISRML